MQNQPVVPIEQQLDRQSGAVNYSAALILGLAAAAVGAGVWYGIVVATNMMVGIIAIGVGFLVGKAVWFGAGRRGAVSLQILGAGLSLVAIVAGEYFTLHHWIRQEVADFNTWLTASQFLEVYAQYLKEEPVTILFYAIALYEGYILPKPTDPAAVVV